MANSSSANTNPVKPAHSHSFHSSSNNNSGFLMKLLPYRRRQSEEVKRTSYQLDDYANLLSRDSHFLGNNADTATVSSATASITDFDGSMHSSVASHRPSVVSVSTVGSFQRQEISLGNLLGKGRFSKVYEITSIELMNPAAEEATNDIHVVLLDATETARSAMSENAREGKYAMKRLRKKLLRRPRDFTRAAAHMVLEAQYLSKLDHPNIVKLRGSALGGASSFESGAHDGYFLILDRVQETLQERIHKTWAVQQPQSRNPSEFLYQKTYYALQIASALQYLHDRRIIFRDLSPNNMGFTEDDSLQLYDFGMARELPQALGFPNELFHMTQNAGTKPYTAVEVATEGLYNLKADVYAWSMVAYEITTEQVPMAHLAGKGKNPFATKEFIQAVYIDGERPSFEGTSAPPKELQELLQKCWQKDVFGRPSMDDVCAELQAVLKTTPSDGSVVVNKVRRERPNIKDMTGFSMTIEI
jgi:serine/threonine protein kinase